MNSIFGTDGIRSAIGTGLFDNKGLQALANALACWLREQYGARPCILIGHDTRESVGYVKSLLKGYLLGAGIDIVDAGILPTPAVFQLIKHDTRFDAGIIISASHNPYRDNGIKIIDAQSGKLSPVQEARITELFVHSGVVECYQEIGIETQWPQAADHYASLVQQFFKPLFLANTKIVLDCAHGAAYEIAPRLFSALGAEVITLAALPDGKNINQACGALDTRALQRAVIEHKADMGFAFDGDADRVMAINECGFVKDGDDILALLLQHPAYGKELCVVGTVMTNQGLDRHLAHEGRSLMRTPVGDKHVAAALHEHGGLLGGEKSGHIICTDYAMTGDGIFAALRVAESILHTGNGAMNTFSHYPQLLINVPVGMRKDLDEEPLSSLIRESESKLHKGRVLVRYSGTELLLRVMVEDDELEHAALICKELSQSLGKILSQ